MRLFFFVCQTGFLQVAGVQLRWTETGGSVSVARLRKNIMGAHRLQRWQQLINI